MFRQTKTPIVVILMSTILNHPGLHGAKEIKITKKPVQSKVQKWVNINNERYYKKLNLDIKSAKSIAFVAQDKSKIVGACIISKIWGNINIKNLMVDSKFRGHGIGSKLISEVIEYGRQNKCKLIFVNTYSYEAPDFYTKLGFVPELKRPYQDGKYMLYLRKEI